MQGYCSVVADFRISRWTAEVACPVPSQPVWPACFDTPERSSSSASRAVRDAWDIYREEFGVVPPELLFLLLGMSMMGLMLMDSGSPGAKVLRSASAAEVNAFFGRGAVRIHRRRLGGRSVRWWWGCRLHRVSQGDVLDASSAQFFVNSSLAPVLLFRWRLKSVADVLEGNRQHGFTPTRLDALQSWFQCEISCVFFVCGACCSWKKHTHLHTNTLAHL